MTIVLTNPIKGGIDGLLLHPLGNAS